MSRIIVWSLLAVFLLMPSLSGAQTSSGEAAQQQNGSTEAGKQPEEKKNAGKDTQNTQSTTPTAGGEEKSKPPQGAAPAPAGPGANKQESNSGAKAAKPGAQSKPKNEKTTTAPDQGSGAEKALQESKKEKEEKQPLSSVKQAATGLLAGKFGIQWLQSYTHLSTNQIFIDGFGILPVLVVGSVDVQRIRRDLFTTTLSFSYSYTHDLQFSFRVPFQYAITRLSQPNGVTGNSVINAKADTVSRSFDLGDLSAGVTYHLIDQGLKVPDVYVGLNLKSRTGRDAFQTKDAQAHPPAGTGYDSIMALASFDKLSAPALLFGSVSYAYNLSRRNVVLCPTIGQCVLLDYYPGANVGLSGGMAISLNYQLTLNFGYQQTINFPAKINGRELANSATNVIMMSIGGTWQFDPKHSVSLTFYQGLTSDSPDFRLDLRVPWQF